jgi:hypothetical protein
MPIREQGSRLFDDTNTFSSGELTEIWEWMDSFDSRPLGDRETASFVKTPRTFRLDRYVFRGRIYCVARCSDGRELLGSVIGVAAPPSMTPEPTLRSRLRSMWR